MLSAQNTSSVIDSFRIHTDVKVTIDKPASLPDSKKTIVIFFALPNGNTTDQTMGKKMQPGVMAWVCTVQLKDGSTRTIAGDVTLIR